MQRCWCKEQRACWWPCICWCICWRCQWYTVHTTLQQGEQQELVVASHGSSKQQGEAVGQVLCKLLNWVAMVAQDTSVTTDICNLALDGSCIEEAPVAHAKLTHSPSLSRQQSPWRRTLRLCYSWSWRSEKAWCNIGRNPMWEFGIRLKGKWGILGCVFELTRVCDICQVVAIWWQWRQECRWQWWDRWWQGCYVEMISIWIKQASAKWAAVASQAHK
jgi:hypothetical protein